MVSILKFGERVQKSEQYPHGWKEIYTYRRGAKTQDSLLGHKSIVCFPGDGVIYEDEMNGFCKHVQSMLKQSGISPDHMPHVYSLGFDTDTKTHRRHILDKRGETRYGLANADTLMSYWQNFFDQYFLPLFQNSDGSPHSIGEIEQNLKNITFVTHCHGSMFAYQMEEMFKNKVKELYPDAVQQILSNIRMLHLSSRKPINQEEDIKHFNVVSLADDMYADYGMLAEDNIYKLLHNQKLKDRTAILPTSQNEAMIVFSEIATPKTYGMDRDDHRQILQIMSGYKKKNDLPDEVAEQNQRGLTFVRKMLRHFVEHPDDQRPLKDIMKEIDKDFLINNLNEGQRLMSAMTKEKKASKSMLDLLAQHTIQGVSADAHLYLQKMSDGTYFFKHLEDQAQKTKETKSLKKVLKHVSGYLSDDTLIKDLNIAIEAKDWRLVDFIAKKLNPQLISKEILEKITPAEMPKLYTLIKEAQLGRRRDPQLLDTLLKKSAKIQNSAGRVKVQAYLEKEKKLIQY